MGARGPLKLPSHLKAVPHGALAGTAAETTPKFSPVKPENVTENENLSALWDEIVPKLDNGGFVAATDGPTLALLVMAFDNAFKAHAALGGELVVKDHNSGDVKKNPVEAIFRMNADLAFKLSREFGMGWAARARTPAVKDREDGESNPFDTPAVGG